MEFQFFGANAIRINTKKANIVIDDNLADLGAKSITKPGDLVLFTGAHAQPSVDVKLVIDQPGEYEVSDTSVQGIAARAHIDEADQQTATIFKLIGDDVRVAVLGHVYPELSDDQLEALGTVDVLFIPVGGNGYTLDSVGAIKLIKKIEPKIVIPTHYADKSLKLPVPQQELEDAIKGLAMEPKERVAKLKVKPGELADTTQLVILERQ
jgi:L-ascorbate metabolism protein UlaG (beta-lactamase superfamily)